MEEIDIKDLLRYFIGKIAVIVIVTIITLLAGVTYVTQIQKPKYNSSTTLVLTTEREVTQNDLLVNQKLVATYREIIKSKKVLNRVVAELDLSYSEEELAKKVTVTSVKETELIMITVSTGNPKLAAKIADTIAEVFCEEIGNIYNIENIKIVDGAEIAKEPYNINTVRDMGIAGVGGIALSFMIIFVMYYFDTTVKTAEQIESIIDIPVVGNVPKYKEKKKKKKEAEVEKTTKGKSASDKKANSLTGGNFYKNVNGGRK